MKNESGNLTIRRKTVRIKKSVKVEDGMEIFSLNIYSISDYHYPA